MLDDFDINEGMDNIVETEGLPYEGRAFAFSDVKQNLMKKGELASEIAKQTKIYRGFTVTANVKVNNNQECALLWIETTYSEYGTLNVYVLGFFFVLLVCFFVRLVMVLCTQM